MNLADFDPNNPDHVRKAVNDVYSHIAQLEALKKELSNRNAAQQQDVVPASRARTAPKLPLADKYEGRRHYFRQFLHSVKLHFTVCPERFPSDAAKTGFVASLLRGAALDWITLYLEKQHEIMNSWTEFESSL